MRSKQEIEKALSAFMATAFPDENPFWTIKLEPPGRSKDANAYCWVLCGKIAKAVGGLTKEEVYRQAIRDAGQYYDSMVDASKLDQIRIEWSRLGIGFWMEHLDYMRRRINNKEYFAIRSYLGSSVYNMEQMHDLIKHIIREAKDLGIETATPDELREMMERWGVKWQTTAG